MNKVVPTKANLIAAKSSLSLAEKGYDLLDKKRTVLIKEMMDLNQKAKAVQDKIEISFKKSYELLADATITMGTAAVKDVSNSITPESHFDIITRSVMGVEIPEIKYTNKVPTADYSIHSTTTAFNQATVDFNDLRILIYELAEIENSLFKLAYEIKKTVKRANALDKIQIPKYKEIVREIESTLEEKEREDFFRLKKVKKNSHKKVTK